MDKIAALVREGGPKLVAEVTLLMGFHTMVSRFLENFEVDIERPDVVERLDGVRLAEICSPTSGGFAQLAGSAWASSRIVRRVPDRRRGCCHRPGTAAAQRFSQPLSAA